MARLWVESYDAAHLDRVSIRSLARERAAEDEIEGGRVFRLVAGYDGIPNALHSRIPSERGTVLLETIATEVHWQHGDVRVEAHTPDGAPLGPFHARRLVVALPLGVLQATSPEPGAVHFAPPLAHKSRDLHGLEMGNVVKVVLGFKERFWQRALPEELGFLSTPDAPFKAWWTGYPVYSTVLVAWTGGPHADALGGLSAERRVDRALEGLARMLGETRALIDGQLIASASQDWAADPFARGAYSYVRVGGMRAQASLARPVDNTLFFAGEATELAGHQATVHGALFAGQRAADEVLASFTSK
jgi:monoamine oxidase